MQVHTDDQPTNQPDQVTMTPEQMDAQMKMMDIQLEREFNLTRLRGLAIEVKKKKYDFLNECNNSKTLFSEEQVTQIEEQMKELLDSIMKIPV
jgi:hypothetical protein